VPLRRGIFTASQGNSLIHWRGFYWSSAEVDEIRSGCLKKVEFHAEQPKSGGWKLPHASRCDGFLERNRVNSPLEYRDLVRQIPETVEQGPFKLLSGMCSMAARWKN
jgi:hypothetical protein